jgi:hypothetical protein
MLRIAPLGLVLLLALTANANLGSHVQRASCPTPTVPAAATYKGVKHNTGTTSRLRISNGGAGQSGLVGALASAFIDYSRDNGIANQDYTVTGFPPVVSVFFTDGAID